MGRERSVNLQESDLQAQFPAMGSQKGVEQLVGTIIE